ncbi:MAG: flagellar biosynthesis protein FlhB [Nitrospirota bacterium]
MPDNDLDKTEQATPKKREEARKKGKVAKSKEVSSASLLIAAIGLFYFMGVKMLQNIFAMSQRILLISGTFKMNTENLYALFVELSYYLFFLLFPFMALIMVVGLSVNILQVGFNLTTENLSFDLNKINPVNGFKNIFSKHAIVEVIKSFLIISLLGVIGFLIIKGDINNIAGVIGLETNQILFYLFKMLFKVLKYVGLAVIVMAILDYAFQKWEYERSLRMTRQEIKEELKESEGDPLIKSKIRSAQMKISLLRMMAEVPRSDAVITNPTHIAVALKYESKEMGAPKVVAKGADYMAEQIKNIAKKHGVPMVEDKPLAWSLYRIVEIGQEVPPSLYKAVAEILAYVYKLGKRRAE